MKDMLYIKDWYDLIERDTTKFKDKSDPDWKK